MTTVIPFPNSRTPGHPVVEHMQRHGIPVTRENFIEWNWPDGKPDPWEADHEADLPDELQDWPAFYASIGWEA
jgi:hypothetical protein